MKKLLIVLVLMVGGISTACQPGTNDAVAPVITAAPKTTQTLNDQYKEFSRVWSERSDNTTLDEGRDIIARLKSVRYATNNLPESTKQDYLLAFMDEMIKALEGAIGGKSVEYINERLELAESNLNAYNKEN